VSLQQSKTVVVIIIIFVYTYDHISQSFPVYYLLIHLPNRQNVFMYMTVLINVRCRSFNTYTRAYSASPPIRQSNCTSTGPYISTAARQNPPRQEPTPPNYAKRHSRRQIRQTRRPRASSSRANRKRDVRNFILHATSTRPHSQDPFRIPWDLWDSVPTHPCLFCVLVA
jgi:hypothetical protein